MRQFRGLVRVSWVAGAVIGIAGLSACGGGGGGSSTTTPPPATGTDNSATVVQSPSGTVTATAGAAATPVTLTFTSSDSNPITNVAITSGLTSLPSGWTGPSSFTTCSSVTNTSTSCVLTLQYAPTAAGSGAVSIGYSYTNNRGTAKTGTTSINYTATAATGPSANNVIVNGGTAIAPVAVALNGSQNVVLTYTTDDGNSATALTADLSTLPAGWTANPTSLTCASVSMGQSCQVTLTYAPTAVANGSFTVGYTYTDHAGTAKNGSSAISYSVTSDNNVTGTVAPAGTIYVAPNAAAATVHVTFHTDDANTATVLAVTLSSLPASWTANPTSFSCATVPNVTDATPTDCQLTLTYAPTTQEQGTLSLPFTYTSNSGHANKAGTPISINYSSLTPYAYIANGSGELVYCNIDNSNGALTNCQVTSGITGLNGVAFDDAGDAYIAKPSASEIRICDVNSDGTLSGCGSSGTTFTTPQSIEIQGTGLYTNEGSTSRNIIGCDLDSNGAVSGCAAQTVLPGAARVYGMDINLTTGAAYFANNSGNNVYLCDISSTGVLSGCVVATANAGISAPIDVKVVGGYAYIVNNGNQSVLSCAVQSDSTLAGCTSYPTATANPRYIAIYNGFAYVTGRNNAVDVCPVNTSTGVLSTCTHQTDATFVQTQQIKIH